MDRFIILDEKNLPDVAKAIARLVIKEIENQQKESSEPDPYLDAVQLSELIPALKPSTIKHQIRTGKYGKKIGARGRLVAKASEVKRHNRL